MPGKLFHHDSPTSGDPELACRQELPELQDAAQGNEAAVLVTIAASSPDPPQALLRQGPLHGEDRDLRRLPAQGTRLNELHAPASSAGRRHRTDAVPRRSSGADASVQIRLIWCDESLWYIKQRPLCVVSRDLHTFTLPNIT